MACKDNVSAPKEVETVVASGEEKYAGSSATFSDKTPKTSKANDSGVTLSQEPVRSKSYVRAVKVSYLKTCQLAVIVFDGFSRFVTTAFDHHV